MNLKNNLLLTMILSAPVFFGYGMEEDSAGNRADNMEEISRDNCLKQIVTLNSPEGYRTYVKKEAYGWSVYTFDQNNENVNHEIVESIEELKQQENCEPLGNLGMPEGYQVFTKRAADNCYIFVFNEKGELFSYAKFDDSKAFMETVVGKTLNSLNNNIKSLTDEKVSTLAIEGKENLKKTLKAVSGSNNFKNRVKSCGKNTMLCCAVGFTCFLAIFTYVAGAVVLGYPLPEPLIDLVLWPSICLFCLMFPGSELCLGIGATLRAIG